MKPSKFSDAQKAFILKQGSDGVPVGEICQKDGISPATTSIGRRVVRPASALVPDACRRPRKVGGLAQVLQ
jgi:putative transposase